MSVTLRSQATGDLVLVNALAKDLLQVLGKDASRPGILEVKDMPQALATLRSLPDQAEPEARPDDEPGQPKVELSFADQPVPLRRRAVPLVRMIEQAQAEDQPIVWGV
ncbi:MAG: hypothetical protein RI907_405 [Pseudomonadota bacterium]|jgi:hypothetical protein